MNDPEIIAIAGDWHGAVTWAMSQLKRAHHRGVDIVLQLGDFGHYGPQDPGTRKMIKRWETRLAFYELHLWWLDGNHENHEWLIQQPINPETGLRDITPHIHHLPRGHRWQWHGRTWMALGGAHSVDRQNRTPGYDWWDGEFLNWAEVEYAMRDGDVDVMLTHDVPEGARCPELMRKTVGWPERELDSSRQHRRLIRMVVEQVHPSVLWHGHMHVRYDDLVEHKGGKTLVHGLDCNGGEWADNMVFVAGDGYTILKQAKGITPERGS